MSFSVFVHRTFDMDHCMLNLGFEKVKCFLVLFCFF